MKLLFRDISAKDGTGKVKIVPEEPEDMWHIYNLVMTGDLVRTTTFRKVRLASLRRPVCIRAAIGADVVALSGASGTAGREADGDGVDVEQQDPSEPDDRGGEGAVRPGHVRAQAEREEPRRD